MSIPLNGEHRIRGRIAFEIGAGNLGAKVVQEDTSYYAVRNGTVIGEFSMEEYRGWLYAPTTDSKALITKN
ncbi:MAG TPA: hypothetical protein VFM18_17575 [Methanosarcina sp.]|nr:hypothetical protein [Methanosarcina sp.]